MVTTGALHAICLILATYIQPGDRVLVEQPTYHGALSAITAAGARPVPVAMTHDGWELDAVHTAVRQLSPSLAYLIPDNQNPTGLSYVEAGRPKVPGAHHFRNSAPAPSSTRRSTDVWLDEPVPPPMAAAMAARRDLRFDSRVDVQVVLGRTSHRLDPGRAQRVGEHRGRTPFDRHGYTDRRTACRCKASRQSRRGLTGTSRDPAGSSRPPDVATASAHSRLFSPARAAAAWRCGSSCRPP